MIRKEQEEGKVTLSSSCFSLVFAGLLCYVERPAVDPASSALPASYENLRGVTESALPSHSAPASIIVKIMA